MLYIFKLVQTSIRSGSYLINCPWPLQHIIFFFLFLTQTVELRQCVMLEELSLEHNKLVRPLLDFRLFNVFHCGVLCYSDGFQLVSFPHDLFSVSYRSMPKLRILRLFGNPLEFLPEILPLHNLRHLTLANIRIEAVESLKSVTVQIEVHKL